MLDTSKILDPEQIKGLSFASIFSDVADTKWWFGLDYAEEFGAKWPYEGEIAPEGFRYPVIKDAIIVVVAMGIFLTLLRVLFDKFVAAPLAIWLGMKPSSQPIINTTSPGLEKLFKNNGFQKPSSRALAETCKNLGIEMRDGERWMRKRCNQMLSSRHAKFIESLWKFVLYGSLFCYGAAILVGEEYFWNTALCWQGYPMKIWAMKESVYWYYMIELGYYSSCLIYQFFDIKRKDFAQMFIHHVCTVMLIGISFTASMSRIGCCIMLLHDFSDIFLEATKMSKYTHSSNCANVFFVVFAVTFFISRILIFPTKLIYSTFVETVGVIYGFPILINGAFLSCLYLLHLFWFSLIVNIIVKFSKAGSDGVKGDERSEDDAVTDSSEDDTVKDKDS